MAKKSKSSSSRAARRRRSPLTPPASRSPCTPTSTTRPPLVRGGGGEALAALAPERVFKTLLAEVDGALTVAVVPVAGSLDLKALASAVGGKRAAMADPAAAERSTGYVRGGISPLGQRAGCPRCWTPRPRGTPPSASPPGAAGLEIELSPGGPGGAHRWARRAAAARPVLIPAGGRSRGRGGRVRSRDHGGGAGAVVPGPLRRGPDRPGRPGGRRGSGSRGPNRPVSPRCAAAPPAARPATRPSPQLQRRVERHALAHRAGVRGDVRAGAQPHPSCHARAEPSRRSDGEPDHERHPAPPADEEDHAPAHHAEASASSTKCRPRRPPPRPRCS